ncbi:MAG TPA: hypothetical protein VGR67_15045 [Candidatus Polarisedimenticolia bacterium]|nr:hypothetical protein [Candidatus Polarisedimenticolia bacterium]
MTASRDGGINGRRRSIALTGWLCVALGALVVLSAAALALVGILRAFFAAEGLDPVAGLEDSLDPFGRMILANVALVSTVQLLLGIATLVIGIGFVKTRPWARPGLEALAWVTLAGSIASGAWGIAAGPGPAPPGGFSSKGFFLVAADLALAIAQCAACVLLIRYLRQPGVRSAFRREAQAGPGRVAGDR